MTDFRPDDTALCLQVDPSLFFPHKGDDTAAGKAVCQSCPLIDPCLQFALHNAVVGVWGGTSETDRSRMRRKSGIVPAPFPAPLLSRTADAVRLREQRLAS